MQPVPFSHGPIYAVISWSACGLWILPELVASITRRSAPLSRAGDRGSLRLIAVLWWTGILTAVAISVLLPQLAMPWKRTVAFAIVSQAD